MLQYLVILLDDTSASYCHADNPHTEHRLMSLDTLKAGILFAMKENLMIQMVYPDYPLPQAYLDAIDTIDHHDIAPFASEKEADVVVCRSAAETMQCEGRVVVLRVDKATLMAQSAAVAETLRKVQRLNVVVTDMETMSDDELPRYAEALDTMAAVLKEEYLAGRTPQLNLLTDRMMLERPNHCNAGVENITLAPNGRFYICPAFYYGDPDDSVGNLTDGLDIRNPQLYRLDHAPLCRHCDAWHCRRCVWLNRKTTFEVNTPSHEQCAVAHTEREASRRLLAALREHGDFLPDTEIKELPYIDPFDVRKEW